MKDMRNNTQITLAWELFEIGVGKTHIARQLGKDRETIRIWIRGVEEY